MTTNYYEAIVLSRPGESGLIPYVGALWAIEQAGILSGINGIACPSTTSFVSVLLISGFKINEIIEILISLPELLLSPIPFKNLVNMGEPIDELKRKIMEILSRAYTVFPTLKQFQEKSKIIVGVGFNLQRQKVEYLHAETHPNMSIIDFICISLSTPGIYKPYKIGEEYWIDGSIIDPFPIQSLEVQSGRILGISTSQSLISMHANEPIGQIKNIIQALFESFRSSSVDDYPNLIERMSNCENVLPQLINVIIDCDDALSKSGNNFSISNQNINNRVKEEFVRKLQCGWNAFVIKHKEVKDLNGEDEDSENENNQNNNNNEPEDQE